MEYWLTSLITHSLIYSLCIIGIVSFLESLALIGLLLPGIVLMATLGTFIGNKKLFFYPSWIAGTIGCLLGDWLSYCIGLYFKKWLHNLSFLKKHHKILEKTEILLHKHSILTILIGRFIGPTRPLIPMVSGMLKLPLKKFILPSFIGCILWPPVYFFPGIIAGITINIPTDSSNNYFKWFLFIIAILIWIGIWLISKWWKIKKIKNKDHINIIQKNIGFIALIFLIFGFFGLILIQFHPTMIIFRKVLSSIL
ncbi:DedA family protein [Buchnera aphidicola]|uniref:DedA family protein n=1 Tax=Buchnera aphidicola (Aphis gossypii) TaxID=98785 RepID=A0A5J6ZE69_9GAMM|nr:DedA family protein [Buchnera aphidicola]QFQ32375.1 DedA family protein [Buchnera aphidicola (Aphis gossypii)]UPT14515.1 DedA family protein [Buchnera aphidicola (Aphis gossypii)]